MTATLSLRAYTGTDAGTESSAQTAISLCAADALSGGDVAPGTRSYERWLRLRVDVPPAQGVTNFWLQNTGDLPDGVSLLFGITDTPTTPVNTPSAVATMDLQSGRRYIFDTNTYVEAGDTTRYVVIQEVAAADAVTGDIPEQALAWGWVEA